MTKTCSLFNGPNLSMVAWSFEDAPQEYDNDPNPELVQFLNPLLSIVKNSASFPLLDRLYVMTDTKMSINIIISSIAQAAMERTSTRLSLIIEGKVIYFQDNIPEIPESIRSVIVSRESVQKKKCSHPVEGYQRQRSFIRRC